MNSILSIRINQAACIQVRKFLFFHLWLPLVGVMLLSGLLMGLAGDQSLADLLYRPEGGQWLLKQHWITEYLIHRVGKWLSIVAGLCLLAGMLVRCRGGLAGCRYLRASLYVVVTLVLSTSLISLVKRLTGMDCPWDLVRYGGGFPFIGLFESRHGLKGRRAAFLQAMPVQVMLGCACILQRGVCPAWRWLGLMIGLVAGLIFGISQQLRGAHFLSHDLWSLTICWLVALGFFLPSFLFLPQVRVVSAQQKRQ